jgi:putative ABC transport system permease protein
MRPLRRLCFRIGALIGKRKLDAEMDDEMRMHLELRIEKNMAAGMSPREAYFAARRSFGGVEQIKERCRDQWGLRWLDELAQDVPFAARMLRKSPGFTAVAVLTLALGVGITSTTFSYLRATVLRPLPFVRPAGLVSFVGAQAPADLLDLKAQNEVFAKFAIMDFPSYSISEAGRPAERVSAFAVGGDFFSMMGVPPLLGRVFDAEEDQLGHNQVVVLSYQYWMRRFSGDPAIVGQSVRLDGDPVQVIGVMPERFTIPTIWGSRDIWRPLAMVTDIKGVREAGWLRAVARLRPSVSLSQAQANVDAIAERLGRDHPLTNAHRRFFLGRLGAATPGQERLFYLMITALSASVLLIACANLANLQLARSLRRSREYAVRTALGAPRFRLLRQMLTESLMLSLIGGVLGVMGTWCADKVLSKRLAEALEQLPFLMAADSQQSLFRLSIDARVLLFAFVSAVATGVIFGILPGWVASHVDVNASLKDSGNRATGSQSRHRLRQTLIVAELTLTLILLAGAGYFANGFRKLALRELGWRADHLLTARIVLPYNRYGDGDKCRAFYKRLNEELAAVPGVEGSALCDSLPVYGFYNVSEIAAEGAAPPVGGEAPGAYVNPVTQDYFEALGMKIRQGRIFAATDRYGAPGVAVISQTLAQLLWPNESPLGKRIGGAHPDNRYWLEVIGVVNEVNFSVDPYPRTHMQLYLPLAQTGGNYLYLAVRTSVAPETLAEPMRQAVSRVDPDLAIYQVSSAEQVAARSGDSDAILTSSLVFMAVSGLLLSALGLYGVIANAVAERTSEIGIRIALGAQLRDVVWLVLGQGVQLAVLGLAAGLAGAWALARILGAFMPGVIGQDPLVIAGCSFLLFGVTLLACWLPARRAARVNPVMALRAD